MTFGMAALLNMGTNFLLGEISFVSSSIAVVLQLALAIDYAIILCSGAWKAIPFTENGSYLIIENPSLENGTAAFCVSGSAVSPAVIITIAAVLAVVIAAAAVILISVKKNKSRKAKAA